MSAEYTPATWVDEEDGGTVALEAANLNHIEGGISDAHDRIDALPTSSSPGFLEVDDYTGTDDEKLAAAMVAAQAATYKPTMRLSSRLWTFNATHTLFTGFKLTGAGAPSQVEQPRSGNPFATEVKVSRGSNLPFLQVTSTVFGCYIGNMAVEGTSSSTFLVSNGGTLWTSLLENLGFSLFKHVLGDDSGGKLLMTACTFQGYWNINNSYDTAVILGGSDNSLWANGCLLDSPTGFTSGGDVPYHLWCDYLEKSVVGPMFITCEGIPAGIRVTGNSSNGALIFTGLKVEGRNAGASSYGSVIRIEGGKATFRDCWFSFGFSASGSSTRANEGGVVTALGGEVLFDGCWYARAGTDGVAESVPWIYASGSGTVVRVRNANTTDDGGTFTQVPLVSAVSSATANVDDSVRTS